MIKVQFFSFTQIDVNTLIKKHEILTFPKLAIEHITV